MVSSSNKNLAQIDRDNLLASIRPDFIQSRNIQLLGPLAYESKNYTSDRLIWMKQGGARITFTGDVLTLAPGHCFFAPLGTKVTLVHGKGVKMLGENVPFDLPHTHPNLVTEGAPLEHADQFFFIDFRIKLHGFIDLFPFFKTTHFCFPLEQEMLMTLRLIEKASTCSTLGSKQILKNLVGVLGVLLFRHAYKNKLFTEQIGAKCAIKSDSKLFALLAYIHENLSGNLSNKVLAKVVNFKANYVGQFFKKHVGVNPKEYIKKVRLSKAMDYVKAGNHKIFDIGRAVGIEDPAHFGKQFKMTYGFSPIKMRQRFSFQRT